MFVEGTKCRFVGESLFVPYGAAGTIVDSWKCGTHWRWQLAATGWVFSVDEQDLAVIKNDWEDLLELE